MPPKPKRDYGYFPEIPSGTPFDVKLDSGLQITLEYIPLEISTPIVAPSDGLCGYHAVTGAILTDEQIQQYTDSKELLNVYPKQVYRANPACFIRKGKVELKENLADILETFKSFENVPSNLAHLFNITHFSLNLFEDELRKFGLSKCNIEPDYEKLAPNIKKQVFDACVQGLRDPSRWTHSSFLPVLSLLSKKDIFYFNNSTKGCSRYVSIYKREGGNLFPDPTCGCKLCSFDTKQYNPWLSLSPQFTFNETTYQALEKHLAKTNVLIHPGWTLCKDNYAFYVTNFSHTSSLKWNFPKSFKTVLELGTPYQAMYEGLKEAEQKYKAQQKSQLHNDTFKQPNSNNKIFHPNKHIPKENSVFQKKLQQPFSPNNYQRKSPIANHPLKPQNPLPSLPFPKNSFPTFLPTQAPRDIPTQQDSFKRKVTKPNNYAVPDETVSQSPTQTPIDNPANPPKSQEPDLNINKLGKLLAWGRINNLTKVQYTALANLQTALINEKNDASCDGHKVISKWLNNLTSKPLTSLKIEVDLLNASLKSRPKLSPTITKVLGIVIITLIGAMAGLLLGGVLGMAIGASAGFCTGTPIVIFSVNRFFKSYHSVNDNVSSSLEELSKRVNDPAP